MISFTIKRLLFVINVALVLNFNQSYGEVVSRSNIIEKIYGNLNETNGNNNFITTRHFETVLKNIGFKDCTKTPSKCTLCVDLDILKRHHNILPEKNELSIDNVLDISSSLVYLLAYKSVEGSEQNFGAVCNTSLLAFPLDNNNAFEGVKAQHGGQGDNTISEEVLESAIESLNVSVGTLLVNKECFDVDDIYEGVNVSESNVDEQNFKLISAFVVLKILNKNCIKAHEHAGNSLPEKESFINELFTEYGQNGSMSLENFEKLLQTVGVVVEPVVTDNHDGHHHKKKRSLDEIVRSTSQSNRQRRATTHLDDTKCYTPESLLEIYGVDKQQGLNTAQFTELCPSVIQQIESGACKVTKKAAVKESQTGWKPWVSSLIAVLIISIGSLAGIVVAPSSKSVNFKLLLVFFIALSVSTLLGDAILHLIPHALNLHKHEDSTEDSHDNFAKDSFLWKCLLVIGGVYVFYLFEVFMHLFAPSHGHSHGTDASETKATRSSSISHKDLSGQLELRSYKRKDDSGTVVQVKKDSGKAETIDPQNEQSIMTKAYQKMKTLHSVVFMILIGDAVHNFIDGVIIGVAFSEEFPAGLSGGISTSIAVLCHEVPHELGDFAVLVAAGISIPVALCLNFLSSLTAFAGAIVGVALGQQWDASPWIFAITAGLFIYIALVDLLPELLRSNELKKRPCITLLLQNLGLLLGFGLMFVLAAFEEDIVVNV